MDFRGDQEIIERTGLGILIKKEANFHYDMSLGCDREIGRDDLVLVCRCKTAGPLNMKNFKWYNGAF